MNSLKPLILMIVLGGVAFGVYRSLTRGPAELPDGIDPSAIEPVQVQLPDMADARSLKTADGPQVLSPAGDTFKQRPLAITPADPSRTTAPSFESRTDALNNAGASPPPFDKTNVSNPTASAAPYGADPFRATPQVEQPQSPAATASPFAAALAQIQQRLAAGQLAEGLKELTAWHGNPQLSPAEQIELQQLLGSLAGTVIYSREHHLAQPYKVQPGERLEDIAKKHNVSAELLAKINDISESAPVVPGEELKVVNGPFSAVIDINRRQFTILLDGCYAGSFALSDLGASVANSAQPLQELTVTQKTASPIYNGPTGEIPADDPANPLGKHLIGLGNQFALHGASIAPSQGPPMPQGGVRLADRDLVDVFDILTVGSRVTIRR